MKRFVVAIGLSSVLLAAALPAAAQPESRAVSARRQLNECMARRMSMARTLSYNEAMRTCKERLQPPKETLAANAPSEPVKPH